MTTEHALTFQDAVRRLEAYWADQGCVIWQPYNVEVGAGTSRFGKTLERVFDADIAAHAVVIGDGRGAIEPVAQLISAACHDEGWRCAHRKGAKQARVDSDMRFLALVGDNPLQSLGERPRAALGKSAKNHYAACRAGVGDQARERGFGHREAGKGHEQRSLPHRC